jgi:L-asparaginase
LDVTLITTGGTIDGADVATGVVRAASALRRLLEADESLAVAAVSLCNKDSREITDRDRESLLQVVLASSSDRILIGHGTFTICETGRFLKPRLAGSRRRVLLVGAWIPFDEPDSDAPRQLQFARAALAEDTPGVYIAMDGRLWDPEFTEKREVGPGRYALAAVR